MMVAPLAMTGKAGTRRTGSQQMRPGGSSGDVGGKQRAWLLAQSPTGRPMLSGLAASRSLLRPPLTVLLPEAFPGRYHPRGLEELLSFLTAEPSICIQLVHPSTCFLAPQVEHRPAGAHPVLRAPCLPGLNRTGHVAGAQSYLLIHSLHLF